MEFVNAFFGKDVSALTFNDLVTFFQNPKGESDKLEFKSFAFREKGSSSDREDGILKTICAMLNSSGGIVIWGAPAFAIPGQPDLFSGDLTPSPVIVGKDRFMNRLSDLITPTPQGVQMIELEGSEGFVYVFTVKQSDYSPHQYKNLYYMRIDGQTRPAPHHYIEALFRRITYPNLEGYLIFSVHQPFEDQVEATIEIKILIFNLSKLQNEFDLGFRLVSSVGSFAEKERTAVTEIVLGGSALRCNLASQILYHNEPFVRTAHLQMRLSDVRRNQGVLRFDLYFAGKQSPLKVSSYKFFGDIVNHKLHLRNEVREENRHTSERADLSMSERQKIEWILQRERGD